jgi:hypothetical protein
MTAEVTEIAAPGRALIRLCDGCDGQGGFTWQGTYRVCTDCDGRGSIVWHACVACGDTAMWRYGNDGVIRCRCGASWTEDDPRWRAQRMPELVTAG